MQKPTSGGLNSGYFQLLFSTLFNKKGNFPRKLPSILYPHSVNGG